ncbi:SpoIIIAH-like family protein [Paenibacillus hamazuiensis]|uniref:SpoIIIAH-like family protein n=1 Tax=Paenibacillus hamazuiensis TaxID=2936508 RepID=UPI002010C31E|nr:SpoIIIAH-like family protein [Paenibacillus hamazuiensis]
MNAKRQTVWLVSMLSLMVVLSAYYLFTEDVNQLEFTGTGVKQGSEIKVTTNEHSTSGTEAKSSGAGTDAAADAKAAAPTDAKTDAKASSTGTVDASKQNAGAADSKASSVKTDAKTDSKSTAAQTQTGTDAAKSDAKILDQVKAQATSGSDFFVSQQLKRNEEMGKQTEKLMTIITDSKQNTEAVSKAYEDLRKLEDKEAKITNLEESLMKDFPQVFVNEEASKWKIVVQTNKLEKSQAVSIVDKVMKEMSVGPENIVVQYMP